MDGTYQTKEEIKKDLVNWLSPILKEENSWEGNNLHIDEINTLENIKRDDWVLSSISVFNTLLKEIVVPDKFKVFLHFDLADSEKRDEIKTITVKKLQDCLNEFTPPSFNCTTLDYYNSFYKQELEECKADSNLFDLFDLKNRPDFFFRSYFDQRENLFSREVYVFVDGNK